MDGFDELGLSDISNLLGRGVYVLIYKGEILYIGRSRCIIKRIGDHQGRIPFDCVYVKSCMDEEAEEARLISKFKPRYNVRIPGPYHNQNLSRIGIKYNPVNKRKYNAIMSKIATEASGLENEGEYVNLDDEIEEINKL